MDKIRIGKNIKKAREAKNMNQKEFAQIIGVTQSNLSSYERGNIPTLDKLLKIANAADVSLDWLCNHHSSPTLKDLLMWFLIAFETSECETSVGWQQSVISASDEEEWKEAFPIICHGDRKMPNFVEYSLNISDDEEPFNKFLRLFLVQLSNSVSMTDDEYNEWKNKYLEFASSIKLPLNETVDAYKSVIDTLSSIKDENTSKKKIARKSSGKMTGIC